MIANPRLIHYNERKVGIDMKIFIITDLEGVSGLASQEQCDEHVAYNPDAERVDGRTLRRVIEKVETFSDVMIW